MPDKPKPSIVIATPTFVGFLKRTFFPQEQLPAHIQALKSAAEQLIKEVEAEITRIKTEEPQRHTDFHKTIIASVTESLKRKEYTDSLKFSAFLKEERIYFNKLKAPVTIDTDPSLSGLARKKDPSKKVQFEDPTDNDDKRDKKKRL